MIHEILQADYEFRKSTGEFAETETLRLFYGPGETSHPELKHLALDLFLYHVWITQWKPVRPQALEETLQFLKQALAGRLRAIVLMDRSEIESDAVAIPLLVNVIADMVFHKYVKGTTFSVLIILAIVIPNFVVFFNAIPMANYQLIMSMYYVRHSMVLLCFFSFIAYYGHEVFSSPILAFS